MNSTKLRYRFIWFLVVWEICKFWILQNKEELIKEYDEFERYVNFEFYKTTVITSVGSSMFERYVNFEFYKTIP